MIFKEIKLKTNHLSALFHFYNDVIELPAEYLDENRIAVNAGESKLIFEKANDNTYPFYHFAFNIPSNKINESLLWLQGKAPALWLEDYNSNIADFAKWNAKSVYFMDPAGNIVELIARYDLGDDVADTFSSKHFRNISEIGLVFSHEVFGKKVEKILSDCRLNYFLKQPLLSHFRAIGDDSGLFIIVPENRNWFPTKKPSGIYPTEVSFINNNELLRLKI